LKRLIPPIITGIFLAVVTIASAQDQCSALEQEAIRLVADTCGNLGRNEVCHGYFRADAQPRDTEHEFSFALGDIVDVTNVASVHTYPFNVETHEWGIALMSLQANLPDELPGANVTFLLLGDTSIIDQGSADEHPMQTLRLETGLMGTSCSEAPSNGLLIQTPHGYGRVTLNINNVEISLGSTVFVDAHAGDVMTISTLEGAAYVSLHGMNQTALPGYAIQIALDEDMNPLGFAGPVMPYQQDIIQRLPISLLERPIEVVTLLTGPIDLETITVFTAPNNPLQPVNETTADLGNTLDNALDTAQSALGNCGVGVGDGSATCENADAHRQNDNASSDNSSTNNAGGNGKNNR